ncbi:methyltransferase domain-containing protein [bacterium]|nr:methyltransferase domain-containing protein [bacterium]
MKRNTLFFMVFLAALHTHYCMGEDAVITGSEKAQKEQAERYTRTATTVFAPLYGPLAEHIVSRFNLADFSGTGVDIGGGPGNLAVELAKRTGHMYWINADINPFFFPFTRTIADDAGVGYRIGTLLADAHSIPLRDASVDIVVSRGSFHLWKDKPRAFSEICRVLKPGGRAFIGRGFSGNLPVEAARAIRDRQRNQGSEPEYDLTETANELETIMKTLGIREYRIVMPRPPDSEGVRYGIWLEFTKEGRGTKATDTAVAETPPSRKDRESVYVLEPIEVTGTGVRDLIHDPLIESPGLQSAVSVVDREDIEKQGASTVIEAMEYVPGAWVETRGRKVKDFFSVRGQTYPYPDYAVDGALYREFHELPSFFTSSDIERIEVMRSSAAMLTGISGLGGVVNIVPRDYTKPETSWELAYGSFDSYRFHISHGGIFRNGSYALGLGAPHTDGPAGRLGNENTASFFGNIRWQPFKKLSIRTALFHMYGKRVLVQALPPATQKLQNTNERYDPLQGTFVQAKALYIWNQRTSTEFHSTYSNRDNTYISQTDTTVTSTHEWDFEWSMNLVQSLALTDRNTLRIGGFYNRWVAPYGKRFYAGRRCDLSTYSLAVVDEHRFGRLDVDAGIKMLRTYMDEYGAFSIEGSAQGFGKVPQIKDTWEKPIYNANAGASYALTPSLSLSANVTGGYIKPRPGTLDIGLEEPVNERRIMVDAGVKARIEGAGDATVTGFFVNQKNAIVLSGKTKEVNGRIMELYDNRDRNHSGIEMEARSVRLCDTARIFMNVTVMRATARIDGTMKRDHEFPRVITGGGIMLSRADYDCNVYLKSLSSYENDRFAASSPVPQPLGDFTTLNITAGRTFGTKFRTRVYIEAFNLTDKRFSTVVGYPDYGRRFTVGIRQVLK